MTNEEERMVNGSFRVAIEKEIDRAGKHMEARKKYLLRTLQNTKYMNNFLRCDSSECVVRRGENVVHRQRNDDC